MKVVDNFLPNYAFKSLCNIVLGDNFSWFYNEDTAKPGDGIPQLIHNFYNDYGCPAPSFHIIEPHLSFFKMKKVHRIKVNLGTKTLFHRKTGYHVDNVPCSTTAILYLNTNNGWTQFKKRGIVKSVGNRVVIFDSKLEHQGVTQTDEKRRVVINFNYEV